MGDVATITRGERFTAADYVKSDGIPCIHYGEIYTDYGTVATKTISQVKPSLRSSLRYAKPGDVIVATTSENVEDVCKAVAWIGNSPVAYHDDSFALTFSGDPVFLVSFFETSGFYAQKSSVAHGVKVMRVSSDSLANINLPTPLVVEQRLIGSYFSRLDFLITLHQRKCQYRGLYGHLSWEQRKFGELYRPVSEKNDLSFGRDRIISVANMYFNSAVYVTEDSYLATYNIMRLGDIAFEGNRNKRFAHGRFVENTIGDGIVSHVFKVFRPVGNNFDLAYWKHAINNEKLMKDALTRSTKASTMMHELVSSDFLEESTLVPSLDEQRAIGTAIDSIDNLITLHQ